MATDLGQAYVQIVASAQGISGSISNALSGEAANAGQEAGNSINKGISSSLSGLGKSVGSFSKNVMPLSAATGALFGASALGASNFNDKMAKMSTLFDTSQTSVEDLSSQFLDLSNQTGISASELAEAGYQALSAGQSVNDVGKFVQTAGNLSKAGFTSTTTAVDVLTTAMNAYGENAGTADEIANKLVRTQNLGKTTVDELAGSMGRIIPTASSMGVNIDNLTSGYVALTKQGIATSEATTYMNSMMNELGDSGSTLGGVLKDQTGKSFQDLMGEGASLADVLQITKQYADENGIAYNELWGSAEAGKAGLAILNGGVDEFNGTVGTMKSKTDDVGLALEKLHTPSTQFNESMNSVKNAGIEMGTSLMVSLAPALSTVAGGIQKAAEWFGGLDSNQQNVILGIAGFLAALGPVTGIIGTVTGVVSTLSGVFGALAGIGGIGAIAPALGGAISAFGPLLLGGAVVVGIGAAAGLIVTHWDDIKKGAGEVVASAKEKWNDFKTKTGEMVGNVKSKWTDFKNDTAQKFTDIKNSASEKITALKNGVTEKVESLKNAATEKFESLKNSVTEKWESLKSGVVEKATSLKDSAVEKFEDLKSAAADKFDSIKDAASDKWSNIKDTISDAVSNIKDGASEKFDSFREKAADVFESFRSSADDKMGGSETIVSDAIGRIVEAAGFSWGLPDIDTGALETAKNFVDDAISSIEGFFDNARFEFPHINLPHFSWEWVDIGGVVSIPSISIDWYAKAYNSPYMFTKPTVLGAMGFGDGNGGEMVYGHEALMSDIREASNSADNVRVLQSIVTILTQYMPELANRQIMLDGRTVVGQLAPAMDAQMGIISSRKARGN